MSFFLKGAEVDGFVLKKDIFQKCLLLYPRAEWERQEVLLRKRVSSYKREEVAFLRQFYRGTAELFLDASGRLLLPARLMDEVDMDKDIVFSGLDTRVEIWSLSEWESLSFEENFESLAEKLLGQSDNFFDNE